MDGLRRSYSLSENCLCEEICDDVVVVCIPFVWIIISMASMFQRSWLNHSDTEPLKHIEYKLSTFTFYSIINF